MSGLSRLLAALVGLVLASALTWFAVWFVDDPRDMRPGVHDWQSASAPDCDVMAKALQAFPFAKRTDPLPLIAQTAAPGRCDWSRYGLNPPVLTHAAFKAKCKSFSAPDCVYTEHINMSRPRYSLLHLRAGVEVAHFYGSLGADGYLCHLIRGFSGWRLQECRKLWIS
jgi:hypothetical protein